MKEGDATIELVKTEQKDLSASLFEIPVGYTKAGSIYTPGPQVNPLTCTR